MPRRRRRRRTIGPLTNITRGPGAWSVHVTRQGRTFTAWFSDAVWGGRQRSLVEARYFRDQLLLRIDPDTRVRRRPPRGTRRGTKMVGVRVEPHVVEGRAYRRAVGEWVDEDGIVRRRRFLVQRYGLEHARRRAAAARKAGVAETRRILLARQRGDAAWRLANAPPRPRQVRDPRSRKGISMARRRPRS